MSYSVLDADLLQSNVTNISTYQELGIPAGVVLRIYLCDPLDDPLKVQV